jgi:uncharacterized membrane protein
MKEVSACQIDDIEVEFTDSSGALIFHLLCCLVRRNGVTDDRTNRRMQENIKITDSVHFKTYLLVVFVVIFGPLGNVLVGKGAKSVGALNSWQPTAVLEFFWRAFTSGTIWLGIASLLTFFVAYIVVLSWADYSFVQPATAISYGVVSVLSVILLHEVVRVEQWVGVGVICLGVFIVGNTSPRTTKPN